MGDMTSEGANLGAGIDLSQFYQVFFEEAGENLDNMEQLLLNLDVANPDDEQMNAIFRCAHSIKGGAATFGFNDVAELTHQMETLLDKLRRHELQPTAAMVDVLLESEDPIQKMKEMLEEQGSELRMDVAVQMLRCLDALRKEKAKQAKKSRRNKSTIITS